MLCFCYVIIPKIIAILKRAHGFNQNNNLIENQSHLECLIIWKVELKGESQGHNAIFKGLKMTSRNNFLIKNYTLQLFSTTTFFTALLIVVNFNFSNAPNALNNLSKLLTTLSAQRPFQRRHPLDLCTFLGRVLGGERGEQLCWIILSTGGVAGCKI